MTQSDTPGEGLDPKEALRIASDELNRLLFNSVNEKTHKAIEAVDAVLASIGSATAGPSDHAGLVERLKHRADTMNGSQPVGAGDGNTYTLGYYSTHDRALDREAITALSRAPEAVGYLFELRYSADHWSGDLFSTILPTNPDDVRNVRPLYATPPAPQPALALIETMERALKPFAEALKRVDRGGPDNAGFIGAQLSLGDLRDARTAIASAKRFKTGE